MNSAFRPLVAQWHFVRQRPQRGSLGPGRGRQRPRALPGRLTGIPWAARQPSPRACQQQPKKPNLDEVKVGESPKQLRRSNHLNSVFFRFWAGFHWT